MLNVRPIVKQSIKNDTANIMNECKTLKIGEHCQIQMQNNAEFR